MSKLWAQTVLVSAAVAVFALAPQQLWAQERPEARLHPTGMIHVVRGDPAEAEPVTIELNAHGPGWEHAPQKSAAAQVGDLPDEAGKQFDGTLPIPNTDGGAVTYVQRVKPLPQGLRLQYDVGMSKDMRLHGLQVSILLPVDRYAGKVLQIARPEGDPHTVTLPREQRGDNFQVWTGEGARIEVAQGDPDALTIQLLAAAHVVVQDLRRWDRPIYEIRFPAIMEDAGRDVTADTRLHLDLTIAFPTPVTLQGP